MAEARYRVVQSSPAYQPRNKDGHGCSVIDVEAGTLAVVGGVAQINLSLDEAEALAARLNGLAQAVS